MSHLPLWYVGSLPEAVCDETLKELLTLPPQDATMGFKGEERAHAHRNTEVRFAAPDYWLSTVFKDFAQAANGICEWGYEVSSQENVQLAKYDVGQHYLWHVDNFPLAGTDTDRKLTVVCLLNDPSEFEGGELKIRLYNEYTAPLVKGSMIAFPSILEHCVTPVLSGTRYSATMWLNGPRFR